MVEEGIEAALTAEGTQADIIITSPHDRRFRQMSKYINVSLLFAYACFKLTTSAKRDVCRNWSNETYA